MTWIEKLSVALPNSVYAMRNRQSDPADWSLGLWGDTNTRTAYIVPTACPRVLFGGTAPDGTDESCSSPCKYIRQYCRECWNSEVKE